MTGRELMDWIVENHAEEHVVIGENLEGGYMKAVDVWEGEACGGAIMLHLAPDEMKQAKRTATE